MKLETISLEELQKQWPATEEGRLCARLLVRYGFTIMVETALGADCTAERAQAESGANKAIAKMVTDFGTLGSEPKKGTPRNRWRNSIGSKMSSNLQLLKHDPSQTVSLHNRSSASHLLW